MSKISVLAAKFGMTQVFGCIDGTHIPLEAPIVNSHDYYNYTQFYSLNVQGFATTKATFWKLTVDGQVAVMINRKMQHKEIPIIYKQMIPSEAKIGNYLIGDPAYPLTSFCMREHESCKSNAQRVFNSIIREARNPIECAYGRKSSMGYFE